MVPSFQTVALKFFWKIGILAKNLWKSQIRYWENDVFEICRAATTKPRQIDFESRSENTEKEVENDDNESLKLTESAVTLSKPADEVKCSLCEFVAKNRFGLKIHFHKKHSTAKFKCFTCDFTCESYSDLQDHNEKYFYSHRQVLNKSYEKHILDEIQHLDQDGFLVHRTLDW